MNKLLREMSENLETIGRVHDLSKVFNDLLTMAICAFHPINIQSGCREKDEDNEKLYLNTVQKYNRDELQQLAECLGLLRLDMMKNPYSDMLGEYFMNEITKGQNGQYFTPFQLCDLMTKLQRMDEVGTKKRVIDPACGSGRMLLSHAKQNPNNYFFGADNNNACAKMAVINFFLNGLTGEIAWMNTLTMEWYGGWLINAGEIGVRPIEKEQSTIWSAPL